MKRFSFAFFAIALVLVVHAFALSFDLYHAWRWFDIPMHFFGGYVMAILGLALYGWVRERVDVRSKSAPHARIAALALEMGFVVGFAVMIGVAWEWFEFCVDQFATTFVEKYGAAQMGLGDTMDDLVNDTIGAFTAWILWRSKE